MKVRLLNDGGFSFISDVEFPVEVEVDSDELDYFSVLVKREELTSIGAKPSVSANKNWTFLVGEFEVVDEK